MSSEISSAATLARQSLFVSLTIMVSRVLGLLRDVALVWCFSAAAWMLDAFYFAFTLPNLLRNLLGEGALTAAFIPEFVRADNSQRARLAGAVITWLLVGVGGITLLGSLGCFFAASLADLGAQWHLTLILLVVTLPFAALICCSAILGAILQCLKVFVLPAAMSCLLNLFIIGVVLAATYRGGEFANNLTADQLVTLAQLAATAVTAAGAAQLLIQYPVIRARGVRLKPAFAVDATLKKIWHNFLPAAVGLGVVQLNSLLDNLLAYGLSLGYFGFAAAGATTYLFLGNRLMQLPLGVFALAAATTAFPTLAALAAKNDLAGLRQTVTESLRRLGFIMLPAAAGLIVLAKPLVECLYQAPDLRFTDAAVYRTTAVLVCLAAALPLFGAIHLFTRAFYALGDYRTPVRIALQTVGVNLVGNLLLPFAPDLYRQYYHLDYAGLSPHLGEAGLALSTMLCACLNALRLWRALAKKLPPVADTENGKSKSGTFGMLISAVGMAVVTYYIVRSVPYGPEFIYRLERVVAGVGGGIAAYGIFASTFCAEDYENFFARWRKKRGEGKVKS
ncbi:hypothetical protein FACS1894139_16870 [Planctomycetales bacterium]|nr:hypothetical protein FACS1894108_13200 [Planctomycetales bacterium]GHT07885.1 hypothetical protein FACS1894139_16870 [Planctomycetales bacterium]